MLVTAERIKICEDGIALQFSWIRHLQVCWVCKHRLHLLLHISFTIRQIDTVTKRLAHLRLTVCSRQTQTCRIVWQQNVWLYQRLPINMVESVDNFTCLLDHRSLILSYRYCRCLERCDISGL